MFKKLFLSLLVVLGASVVSFAAATTYCTPNFTYGTLDGDYVARVLLTGNEFTLDNVTAGAGGSPAYTYYTTGTTLSGGQAYSITVRVGTYPTRQGVAAWIDYNGNGVFETAERLGMTVNSITANSFVTFNFTVPTVGASGVTRMRVIEETYVTSIDPCTITDIYGETEDYDITLVGMIAALVGGQGYKKIPTDICPDGDFSPTPYDGLCAGQSLTNGGVPAGEKKTDTTTGAVSNTGTSLLSGVVVDTGTISTGSAIGSGEATDVNILPVKEPVIVGVCLDKEQQGVFSFASRNEITTKANCIAADMDGLLIRSNAAKMISNFVMNVMDRKPDTTKKCEFVDMTNQSSEMQKYAILSCQLGLMGLNGDGSVAERFDPTNLVTKAQFATILSRLIYGEKNNSTEECRYCKHVEALQAKKVITVTTDLMEPLKRGWAMLMLMRVTRL